MSALLETTAAKLDLMVRRAQREWRTPSLSAGLVRDGELVWSTHVGWADVAAKRPATDDTQYLIGSITKTFTAVLVMMLRDEGKLALDDPIGKHLPGVAHPDLTVRTLLAHASGLQREFATPVWETLQFPERDELLATLDQTERVLKPNFEYHYSNLAFALLGQLVAQLDGKDWEDVLRERLTGPLCLSAALRPDDATRARGYYTHPYTHAPREEPVSDMRAVAPLGGLWASVADLARYAAFVADPDPAVLAPSSVDEMLRPLIICDLRSWSRAYGLGFSLYRLGEHISAGHDGAMPGFLSGLRVNVPGKVGAVVLANSTSECQSGTLAHQMVVEVLDAEPRVPEPWTPTEVPEDLAELTGTWWTEGDEIRFVVEDGELVAGMPMMWDLTRSRFERVEKDVYRVAEGRERGEKLVVVRDAEGKVDRMRFVTYAVTREPLAFDQL